MKTIVVGGHSRKVGKTSIGAAIIATWPHLCWTAVKITSHWHGEKNSPRDAGPGSICRIDEEYSRDGDADTSRYLAAGASRAFWVRIQEGRLGEALPRLMPVIRASPYVLIESNGIVRHMQPDLYLMVHRYDIGDYKKSALETLPFAHAVVAVNHTGTFPAWEGVSPDMISGIPVFPVPYPVSLSQPLMEFIGLRLG
jgi:hypothetical protein